jgi:hypothetical protein
MACSGATFTFNRAVQRLGLSYRSDKLAYSQVGRKHIAVSVKVRAVRIAVRNNHAVALTHSCYTVACHRGIAQRRSFAKAAACHVAGIEGESFSRTRGLFMPVWGSHPHQSINCWQPGRQQSARVPWSTPESSDVSSSDEKEASDIFPGSLNL